MLHLLVAVTALADNPAPVPGTADGTNISINMTQSKARRLSTDGGLGFFINFTEFNVSSNLWNINATPIVSGFSVSDTGNSNGTISSNGTFWINSSVANTFDVNVSNSENSSEWANLTGFSGLEGVKYK